MLQLYVGLQILVIMIILFALRLLLHSDGTKEQKLMCYFLWGTLIQNAGYLLELISQNMEAALTATKIQYLGSVFIPLCYCWFMFSYCDVRVPKHLLDFMNVIDLVVLGFIFSCEHHQLYYKQIEWVVDVGDHPHLQLTYGPVYFIFLFSGCGIPYLLSLYPLLHTIFKRKKQMPGHQYKIFSALSCFPVLALAVYSFRLNILYDTTPFVLGISLALVVVLVWSRRNFDFSRMAASVALNHLEDGVILLDEHKGIANFNRAAATIFTELNFQITGDSIEEVEDFPSYILDMPGTCHEFVLNRHSYECHVRRVDGKNRDSQGYVLLVRDISATKKYISEIDSLRIEAERANIAKSEFLATMFHEIRTPMNAIVGFSDIIMEESRGRTVYGYACDIKAASQNLLSIINDILDLSAVESGKMELIQVDYYVKSIVNDVINMMDISASQKGLLLQCDYDTTIPCQYHGDDGRIRQILIYLMNNAVKFTREGHVKLGVSGYKGAEPDSEILVFRIEDTGCGIEAENLEKIFEDFKQVDSKRNRVVEGAGVGLSITRRLVQLMKGTIEVESIYGEGTVFTVKLPQIIVDQRTLEEVPDVPVNEQPEPEDFVVENYKVLVVDDNLINRKVAMGFLKNYGFDLTEAESGPQAIDLVNKTMYNMIFMDHMMPGMDGVETVKIIREECGINGKSPIIIALTANAMEGAKEKFLQCGFQGFLPKPLDRKSLNEMLDKWIPDSYKLRKNHTIRIDHQDKEEFENIKICGIDIEEAMKHHTGDVEDFHELLNLYCMEGKRKCVLLRKLVETKDFSTYGIEVHGLKSASANIGAMELSKQAREHEDAVKRKDEGFVTYHFRDLLKCYQKQVEDIQNYLDDLSGKNEEETGGNEEEIQREDLLREVREAYQKVEDFRSKECARIVNDLLKYQMDQETRDRLTAISDQLRMYEDDEAEKLLQQMILWLEREA